ncbi:TfoX/Sxy family protein [Motiliproteus sediminis]|uniref:TfoX/Sxy family protein n=1 Tax=Motiliproteus sediminis TaxID=1468178 RepID=UPI001AEFA65D|nr:TfoX/Sxy family protein [Motiliproteus sediminis]
MAYDQGLAQRIREYFATREQLTEKRMFGGLCFLLGDHMVCGVVDDTLMVRIGPERYDEYLRERDARLMDFTGKPMKGMLFIAPEGVESDDDLARWLERCISFVTTLPPKKPRQPATAEEA